MPHLKVLNLSFNPNIGPEGAVPLIRSLGALESLEELDFNKTAIGVEDCRALSELLSVSTSHRCLDVGDNDLPPEGVELVISGLSHNTTLKQFYVHGSHFSRQNTISLASVLKTSRTLVSLKLVQCHIDPDGVCQLASALCTNDTLQWLDLHNNPIGVKGAAAFAEVVLKNKSLTVLSLADDSIGEEGTQMLIESSTHNNTLHMCLSKKYKPSIATSVTDNSPRVQFD